MTKRYVHIPAFLSEKDQMQLAKSVITCHHTHSAQLSSNLDKSNDQNFIDELSQANSHGIFRPSDSQQFKVQWEELQNSKSSLKLNLGLKECGGDLNETLPLAVKFSRKAFKETSIHYEALGEVKLANTLRKLAGEQSPACRDGCSPKDKNCKRTQTQNFGPLLTGLGLLYGPNAVMRPHYDSSTQPGQREEWLVMFTIGSDVLFRCNDNILTLTSGDALIMDSMSVLHGVEGIRKTKSKLDGSIFYKQEGQRAFDDAATYYGLPLAGSRLGVLLWQGRMRHAENKELNESAEDISVSLDGFSNLFDG